MDGVWAAILAINWQQMVVAKYLNLLAFQYKTLTVLKEVAVAVYSVPMVTTPKMEFANNLIHCVRRTIS
jgi:hypothetical protein